MTFQIPPPSPILHCGMGPLLHKHKQHCMHVLGVGPSDTQMLWGRMLFLWLLQNEKVWVNYVCETFVLKTAWVFSEAGLPCAADVSVSDKPWKTCMFKRIKTILGKTRAEAKNRNPCLLSFVLLSHCSCPRPLPLDRRTDQPKLICGEDMCWPFLGLPPLPVFLCSPRLGPSPSSRGESPQWPRGGWVPEELSALSVNLNKTQKRWRETGNLLIAML